MLVVSNGAFKSGSTWLFSVAKILVPHSPLPEAFRATGWKNDSLSQPALTEFLSTVERKNTNYVVKNHLEKLEHRELLLSQEDVLVLAIRRDMRDTIVSAYYHDMRNNGFKGTFELYFNSRGRQRMYEISRYHRVWEEPHPRLFQTSYEDFHLDFSGELRRMAAFLGREIGADDLRKIRESTSFDRVQRVEKQRAGAADKLFFRKGVVGDWRNHFTPRMEVKLNQIVAEVRKEPPGYIPKRSLISKVFRLVKRLVMGVTKSKVA